jgi:hypothetical protein
MAGTRACWTCSNREYPEIWSFPKIEPIKQRQVIEKFDDKGNLIERITEI